LGPSIGGSTGATHLRSAGLSAAVGSAFARDARTGSIGAGRGAARRRAEPIADRRTGRGSGAGGGAATRAVIAAAVLG